MLSCLRLPQDASAKAAELKDVPSLDKMLSEIKEEPVEADDGLEDDFKAEAISSENMVRCFRGGDGRGALAS